MEAAVKQSTRRIARFLTIAAVSLWIRPGVTSDVQAARGSVAEAPRAEQIHLLSSVAAKAVIEALTPAFEKSAGHTVTPLFGIAADLKTKAEAGEPFDVAILTAPL